MTYKIPVTYVRKDSLGQWETEDAWIPPVAGQGVINERGERFRIVDVWVNKEKHGGGLGDYGVYAFVEPATMESDLPAQLYAYYGG